MGILTETDDLLGQGVALGPYTAWGWYKRLNGSSEGYPQYSRDIMDFKAGKGHTRFLPEIERRLKNVRFVVAVVPSHEADKPPGPLHRLAAAVVQLKPGAVDGSGCLVRHTTIQKLAAGGDRSIKVHLDSIRVVKPALIKGQPVLLLDDVSTTGHSIQACRLLLTTAGAASVEHLVLGQTT